MEVSHTEPTFNPWTGDDADYGLKQAIALCEETGHIGRRDEIFAKAQQELKEMKSQKLMDLQQSISQQNDKLDRVNFDIQRRALFDESKDIIDDAVIEKRTETAKALVDHIQNVLTCKKTLVTRLQQPHVSNFLQLQADYHKYVREFFAILAPLLSDLSAHLEDIRWINVSVISGSQLDSLVTELSSAMATLETHFQTIDLMARNIYRMHGAEDSFSSLET